MTKHSSDTQQGACNTHRKTPEVPGSSEQETLYCKDLRVSFFIKSLFSRAESIHGFLDTEKQTQRSRHNEEKEKFI